MKVKKERMQLCLERVYESLYDVLVLMSVDDEEGALKFSQYKEAIPVVIADDASGLAVLFAAITCICKMAKEELDPLDLIDEEREWAQAQFRNDFSEFYSMLANKVVKPEDIVFN